MTEAGYPTLQGLGSRGQKWTRCEALLPSSKTLVVSQAPRLIMEADVPSLCPLSRSPLLSPSLSLSLEATTGPTRPRGGVQVVQSLELSVEAHPVSVL